MVVRSEKEVRASDIELYGYLKSQLNALRCPSEFNGTSHVHLLVHGHENKDVIPRSLQLIAGRTGQEYNQRKKRKGAFWEDRYHATAVDVDEHLVNCLVYIDIHPVK